MFNVGDAVIYGNTGVCIIDDIRLEDFVGKKERYYILKPVFSKGSTIFCPVDNVRTAMRSIASRDELTSALANASEPIDNWIENDQQRREYFSSVLKRCDLREMTSVVHTLCKKKKEKTEAGKKFHAADEKALAEAEKILFGELSYVLDIDYDEAAKMFEMNF